jgi:O-acetyl-ADP-ribose deacetylase (regulator of RNase III)
MAFSIIRNDLTKVSADAIVNTANPKPVIGGGTDAAVYAAAGEEALLAERARIGEIAPGEAFSTPAFALDAKYIIHTVGPLWEGGENGEFETLANCYRNSLKLASDLGCTSVAFPLISTGVYAFPKDMALRVAVDEIRAFLDGSEEDMDITLVVFDRESYVLSGNVFEGVDAFIDGNYVEERLDEEYAVDACEEAADVCGDASMQMAGAVFSDREDIPEERKPSSKRMERASARSFQGLFHVRKKEAAREAAECDTYEEDVCEKAMEAELAPAQMGQRTFFAAAAAAPRSLDDVMKQVGETWQESLFRFIDEKGYTDTEVYKRANVDRKLFSKIRSNPDYQPKKMTAVAFALALRLNLDETKDFLGRAGYAFSPGNRFDLIVEYFIQNEVYDTYTINMALFDHDQPLIGA